MRLREAGPTSGPDVVIVLGWGNRLHHENVQWLSDQLTEAGYRTHTFQIPDVIDDFEREYLAPVREYVAELGAVRLVGHSTGGLITAFLDWAKTNTYLSPWWGIPSGPAGLDVAVLSALSRIPTRRPLVPVGQSDRQSIGDRATEKQLREGPTRAAPSFLREIRRAHSERPPVSSDAVVFCSPRDTVVSVRAIAEAASFDQLVFYDGGHELFSSKKRDTYRETLLDAVANGRDALDA
ncbi:Lysophospholipase, alpha-beta hydrolase superfamily [Halovenus aranensis]|uniref:Lysophospholipase, alpha-beta hydrolase superfamily n=1 Tax=Halovenus aranensis TaxID=890420 RepID=A0A1G8YEA9_9EURY|nr:alpha/beta fold hydrolase [Halovenus aranensis]SDK01066.1 Lysophospholipase, alpha-beta hydrolase superfamily [Halovenus aranensis]